jgi:ceramide glucosyltransferase
MFSTTVSILLALAAVALVFHLVGMFAALRFLGRGERAAVGAGAGAGLHAELPGPLPPVTLLKPLKGLEDGLEANLSSFYEQRYPGELQVVFASTEPDDPALRVARAVAARHPAIATDFVRSRDDYGLNPKVSNMRGALLAARHDLVLQSDANVRLPAGHLQRMVSQKIAQDASLLGSLVVGVGERTPAATLENLQLTAFTAPGLCIAKELVDITCVLGKAMLFSRRELESLGGIAAVKDVLAEDFVMCQLYQAAGKRLVLSPEPVANVNAGTRWPQFFARHSRWMKMRVVASLPGYFADLGGNPLPFALAAWLASGCDRRVLPLLLFVYAYKCAWDARLLVRLRGHGLGWTQLWATPARDLALTAVWAYALFSRTTVWRGKKLRLSSGTRLLADDVPLSQRLLRRMGLLRG